MLTRIYGTAFATKDELAEHLERLEQARAARPPPARPRARPLRVLGHRHRAPPFWLPNGTASCELARRPLARDGGEPRLHRGQDPEPLRRAAVEDLGHWDKYRDNMFVTESEGKQLAMKPMNCPGHCQLYKLQKFSYRDLPIRYSEPGLAAPQRALRRPARADAGAAHHPGRRARLLHRGPDPAGGRPPAWSSRSPPTSCSASTSRWSSPPGPSSGSAPTSCGITPRPR